MTESVTVKPIGCGLDPPLEEVKYLLKFIFALVSRERRGVATQQVMPLEFGRKWGTECLMILGSLCLPCCVRDTA